MSIRFNISLAFSLLWLVGCASLLPPKSPIEPLSNRLCNLSPTVDPCEASLAADTAYSYSLQLAMQYHTVRPAVLHNVLVNLGLRKRGLCFHWADDLSAKLESLNLRTLQLHRGVSRLETSREHSTVVLTALGQPFEQGVVLDAWRYSGRLYWCGVQEDKYSWIRVEVVVDSESSN